MSGIPSDIFFFIKFVGKWSKRNKNKLKIKSFFSKRDAKISALNKILSHGFKFVEGPSLEDLTISRLLNNFFFASTE